VSELEILQRQVAALAGLLVGRNVEYREPWGDRVGGVVVEVRGTTVLVRTYTRNVESVGLEDVEVVE
jgi:hypothetical protein